MSHEAKPQGQQAAEGAPRGIPFGYIVIGLVVLGIVVLIAATTSGGRYELEVGQVVDSSEKYLGKNLRVRGQIKEGSIFSTIENGSPLTRFVIADEHGQELTIVTHDTPPDNFEPGKSCIIEGQYTEEGHVESTRITMKCPSKYETDDGQIDPSNEDLYQKYRNAPSQAGTQS